MQSRLSPKHSRVTAILFFNSGARLGWMIQPHRFITRKKAVVSGLGEYRVGVYGCGTYRPHSGSNPGPSSPKWDAITTALSRPTVRECRSLEQFPYPLRKAPTEDQPMDPQPNNVLSTRRGLDLYGRPRSTAIAPSLWERTPGSHTTQGASCIQDAATPSVARIAATPVQCGQMWAGAVAEHEDTRARWYEDSAGLLISALLWWEYQGTSTLKRFKNVGLGRTKTSPMVQPSQQQPEEFFVTGDP